jgi:putative SOS response-associated peptidase YedK
MCNLYSMTRNREAILRLFRVSDNRAAAYESQSAIFPGYQAPIVCKAADGERELAVVNWGFVLLQKDRAPRRVTKNPAGVIRAGFILGWCTVPRP